jgi:DNA adenine methylase
MATSKNKLIAFGWYGGKYSHLNWLLPLLPKATHYCEPFGGSAAVLVNREPAPVETYNDIDGQVVTFFRVLRDQKDALIEAIGLTPFSREEFRLAVEEEHGALTDLERARRFFIRARQVRTGLAQTASEGRWANCVLTSRAGMAGAVSRWLGSIEGLSEIAQRLLRVQIENDSAINIIQRYDSPETLFYCDPPYVHASRSDTNAYAYEMSDDKHRELAAVLHQVQGKVALSGYHCTLMDELYADWAWVAAPTKKAHSTNTGADNNKQNRTEVLWVNYELPSPHLQATSTPNNEAASNVWNGQKQSLPTLFDTQSEH